MMNASLHAFRHAALLVTNRSGATLSRPGIQLYAAPQTFRPSFFSTTKDSEKGESAADTPNTPKPDSGASAQHMEWVKFQQSIAVKGFDTGQTTAVVTGKKKNKRSAQRSKLNEEQEKILERQRLAGVGGGEYPPMRYSEEETQRLLEQAYAAIPARAGKRGTRNKKRQERRWQLVREIRAKYKAHMAAFQERKMKERSKKVKDVKAMLSASPDMRQRDKEYQLFVYQRWASTMKAGSFAPKLLGDGSSGS